MHDFSNNFKEQMIQSTKHCKYVTLAFNDLYKIHSLVNTLGIFCPKGLPGLLRNVKSSLSRKKKKKKKKKNQSCAGIFQVFVSVKEEFKLDMKKQFLSRCTCVPVLLV